MSVPHCNGMKSWMVEIIIFCIPYIHEHFMHINKKELNSSSWMHFKQEEELMYNGNSLLREAWKQLHIETLFYETCLLASHTGAIYFTIQNEYFALWKKKDMKSLTSTFQIHKGGSTDLLIHYWELGRDGLKFKQGRLVLDINKIP